ncbi:thioesterase-like superfamily-domain-containing protein [Flammula alnicola]|nr:thioesterase-like superfamily-domain-containing protein [Flammula alnicola]
MAPIGKAIEVQPIAFDSRLLPPPNNVSNDSKLYSGIVDPEWTIGSVANGGYVLGLILEACIQYQSSTPHVDPLHVTAYYLRTTFTAPFTVCVRTVKTGSGFTNLTADLVQEGIVKIMTHLIFGLNGPHPKDKLNFTLNPPSTYARRHPLYTHPSQAATLPIPHYWKFHHRVKRTKETDILEKNKVDSPNRTTSSTVGGGGLEWGTWFEFSDKDDRITAPSLALLVDIFSNTPSLLPKSERATTGWYPTMTLSIEFKNKIPPPSHKHAARTVGVYSQGRYITPPQGRHDIYCEVWTAPSSIGEGKPTENWRDDQVCLAIATQMALTLPLEVGEKQGIVNSVKL